MADQIITPEVAGLLQRSTITATSVTLPPGKLDRKLYEEVNRVLTFAGGKWNRSAQAHVFSSDPRPKLGIMTATGVAVDEKKKFQAFFTPPELADEMAQLANVRGHSVLEPSAGSGNLVNALWKAGAEYVTAIEIQCDLIPTLDAITSTGVPGKGVATNALCEDFLKVSNTWKFTRIVMNPPFTRGTDLKHIAHALTMLGAETPADNRQCILVSLMAAGKSKEKLDDLCDGFEYQTKEVPAGTFKESGTNIATTILIVKTK